MAATRSFIIAAILAVLAIAAMLAFIMSRPGTPEPAVSEVADPAAVVEEQIVDAEPVGLVAPPVFDIVRVAPEHASALVGVLFLVTTPCRLKDAFPVTIILVMFAHIFPVPPSPCSFLGPPNQRVMPPPPLANRKPLLRKRNEMERE